MKTTAWVTVLLCVFVTLARPAFASTALSDHLKSPEGQARLAELTRAPETLNKVTLLHLGERSMPTREKLISDAKSYVFITVPFWFHDESGQRILDLLKSKEAAIDYRVLQDWASPFFGHGSREVGGELKGHIAYWNSPTWQRNFSYDFRHDHVHDKMFIVDGEKMIVGGMNIADEYLQGGENAKGWHDTDLLIEGPAAREGAKIFIKLWQLTRYLASDLHFPPFKKLEIAALQNYFYNNQEDHDFYTTESQPPYRVLNKVHIPIKDALSDPKYFPPLENSAEFVAPVRLIYDNPLIDRDARTGKRVSKARDTIRYLLEHAGKSAWFFIPYLTPDKEFFELLTNAAKRLDITILTNSAQTWDVGLDGYKAQASHYAAFIKAGVKIYEWQGHVPLVKLSNGGCKVIHDRWPGHTLHSKVALFDGSVVMIGSNNLNHQSLKGNNEVMALVNDPSLANEVENIFLQDFHPGSVMPSPVKCGGKVFTPSLTERIDEVKLQRIVRKYKVGEPVWKYPIGL